MGFFIARCENQQWKQVEMKDTLLCDNESSCDTFCNPKHAKNVRKAQGTMMITSNGSNLAVNTMADPPNCPKPVWFNK